MNKAIKIMALVLTLAFCMAPYQQAYANPILGLGQAVLKKIIKAADLKIQRLQNRTIWLQNAQQVLENTLSKMKLEEISDWSERQRKQFQTYYDELSKVKSAISYYQRIKEVTAKEARLVKEYQNAWRLLSNDQHFDRDEIQYMDKVYNGILNNSIENLEQIMLVMKSFSLRMTDADRLELVNDAADRVDQNFDDLKAFNTQNMILSLQRARGAVEIGAVKKYYGLN